MTSIRNRRRWVVGGSVVLLAIAAVAVVVAQTPPDAPPVPVVVGRDAREGGQLIGKQYALRVRLLDVQGPGVQQVRVVRVAADGNVTLPRIAPMKAEGVALATLEAQATAAYKAVSPTAAAYLSIADRNPPPPPPPPPPPASAPATTQPVAAVSTQPTTKTVATATPPPPPPMPAAPATQPAPQK